MAYLVVLGPLKKVLDTNIPRGAIPTKAFDPSIEWSPCIPIPGNSGPLVLWHRLHQWLYSYAQIIKGILFGEYGSLHAGKAGYRAPKASVSREYFGTALGVHLRGGGHVAEITKSSCCELSSSNV